MVTIVPRSVIGLPEPPSTRPKLASNRIWLLAHYTGVNGYKADPTKDLAYAKSVASFGLNRTPPIPYEYNYLIGPGGTIYEQAGTYKGAHCLNLNPDSIGVLFMLGIGVEPTEAMFAAWWELRDHLVATGALHPNHMAKPHYAMRATACCGNTLAEPPGGSWPSPTGEGRTGELRLELRFRSATAPPILEPGPRPPDPTPTPPPGGPLAMFNVYVRHTGNPRGAVYACFGEGAFKVWMPNGAAWRKHQDLLRVSGKPVPDVIDTTETALMEALGPIWGPLPDDVDTYGTPIAPVTP